MKKKLILIFFLFMVNISFVYAEDFNITSKSAILYNMNEENLYVKTCFVDEGMVLKRAKMDSRGHVGRNDHKTSHITVIVAEK